MTYLLIHYESNILIKKSIFLVYIHIRNVHIYVNKITNVFTGIPAEPVNPGTPGSPYKVIIIVMSHLFLK